MTYRDAFLLTVDESGPLSAKREAAVKRARGLRGRRAVEFWARKEARAIRRYERQTGKKLGPPGTIDWSKLLDWLKENLPTLLQLLMSLIGLFAKPTHDEGE